MLKSPTFKVEILLDISRELTEGVWHTPFVSSLPMLPIYIAHITKIIYITHFTNITYVRTLPIY